MHAPEEHVAGHGIAPRQKLIYENLELNFLTEVDGMGAVEDVTARVFDALESTGAAAS